MNKIIIVGLIIIGGIYFAYHRLGQTTSDNNSSGKEEILLTKDSQKEAVQQTQEVSTATVPDSIESDLNNTVIQDEDFSDLE